MARQIIDTTTANSPIGDPAKTSFEKCNLNFAEIYGWGGGGALAKLVGGNNFIGVQNVTGVVNTISQDGPAGSIRSNANEILMQWGASYNAAADGIGWFSSKSGIINLDAMAGGRAALNVGTLSAAQNIRSSSANLVLSTTGNTGAVFIRPQGQDNTAGQVVAYPSGTVTAVAFTPTSSADVKQNLEGFDDADALIERLVVITHKYREDFCDSTDTHLSLLAENVRDVYPSATAGGITVVELIEKHVETENGVKVEYEEVVRSIPLGVSLMPILALCVRSHQQKNRRIAVLEEALAAIHQRLDALEPAA